MKITQYSHHTYGCQCCYRKEKLEFVDEKLSQYKPIKPVTFQLWNYILISKSEVIPAQKCD
jgi:hypothetical protein